jgi:uncharacterized protein YabE (DUF348 family)
MNQEGGVKLKLLVKNILKYFSYKEVAAVLLAIVFAVTAGVALFMNMKRDVVVNVDGKTIEMKTMRATVDDVLKQNNIEIGQYDYISQPLDAKLQRINKNEINIKRAFPIYVQADGKDTTIMTYKNSVSEALHDANISLNGMDRLEGATLYQEPVEDMKLKIVRVTQNEVAEYSGVPFETIKKENSRMDMGTEKVVNEGKEGTREKKFLVTLEDGVQTAKNLVTDTITANPIEKIIEFGTILNHQTARGGIIRYEKVLDMSATAYSLTYEQTGKNPGDYGYGITASGMKASKGVIAVDPRVIPLGTRVYVEVSGNTPDYGYAVAGDTGSGIYGNRVDLFYDDYGTAVNFGSKRVKVYVLTN